MNKARVGEKPEDTLCGQVKIWPTPDVSDRRGPNSDQVGLSNIVKKQFPTPSVCGNHNRKGASESIGDGLSTAAKQESTPRSGEGKKMCCGKLNPRWVETLMGLPIGWVRPGCTDPRHPADTSRDRDEDTRTDNRTDELRMLGNGVVPDTVEKAGRTLLERIMK